MERLFSLLPHGETSKWSFFPTTDQDKVQSLRRASLDLHRSSCYVPLFSVWCDLDMQAAPLPEAPPGPGRSINI